MQDLSGKLPDEAAGEFNIIRIARTSDTMTIMTMDSSSNVEGSTPFRSTHSVEVQLQIGKWSDIDSGATLQMKATKKGEKQLKEAKKVLGESFKLKLKAQMEEQGISSSASAKIKTSSGEIISISKDRLVVPQDKLDVTITLSIRI